MKRSLLAIGLWLGLTTLAIAQTSTAIPTPGAFTGTEKIRCTANSGSACEILLNHVRNTVGHLLIPTGTTVTTIPNWYQANIIATGAITTWAVSLPDPAPDSMVFTVVNGTGSSFSSNVTVTAQSTPQAHVLAQTYSSQTIAAGASVEWQFDLATLTWYRIH